MKARISKLVEEILDDNSKEGVEARKQLLQSNLTDKAVVKFKEKEYILSGNLDLYKTFSCIRLDQ